jgi:hypothetical protein
VSRQKLDDLIGERSPIKIKKVTYIYIRLHRYIYQASLLFDLTGCIGIKALEHLIKTLSNFYVPVLYYLFMKLISKNELKMLKFSVLNCR